jgi:hypothetical protein
MRALIAATTRVTMGVPGPETPCDPSPGPAGVDMQDAAVCEVDSISVCRQGICGIEEPCSKRQGILDRKDV